MYKCCYEGSVAMRDKIIVVELFLILATNLLVSKQGEKMKWNI